MMRIRRILLATDFSRASGRAFTAAMDLAKQNKAELTIFHTLASPLPYMAGEAADASVYIKLEADARRHAESVLSRLKARAERSKVKVRTLIRKGNPHDQILRSAKDGRVDLIVMGTHGRTGLSKLFLGSVASRVISGAHRPVLTVPGR